MNFAEKNNRQQANPSSTELLKIDSPDSTHKREAKSVAELFTRNGQIMGSGNSIELEDNTPQSLKSSK